MLWRGMLSQDEGTARGMRAADVADENSIKHFC